MKFGCVEEEDYMSYIVLEKYIRFVINSGSTFYGGAATSRLLCRSDFQLDASLCLENTQDGKNMCGTRVSVWAQHSMETHWGFP